MKARTDIDAIKLEQVPNIGKRVSEDLRLIGVKKPSDLKNKNPLLLYKTLCKKVGFKVDYCMIDVLMSAIDFMNGAKPTPWWFYTAERKKLLKKNLG